MLNFKKNFEINYQDVDYMGNLKVMNLLNHFSNIATSHAILLDAWNEDLINDYGWVMAKMHIEILKPITAGNFDLLTYPGIASKVIYPRYYQIFEGKEAIVKASSIWTLLDLKKRRITSPKKAGVSFPDIVSVYEEISLPAEINKTLNYIKVEDRQVRYSDVDTNQHMNNAKYIEWVMDLIDYNFYKDHYIDVIDIFYKKEIKVNSYVSLYMAKDGCSFYFKGIVDEIVCFEIMIHFNNK